MKYLLNLPKCQKVSFKYPSFKKLFVLPQDFKDFSFSTGFYSAWSEQPTYLWWSTACMTVLTICVLSVGIGMITARHRLESEGFEADFKNRARLAYVEGSETNRAYIDAIQETLQCCGAK
jgi:hypothetical protein